MLSNKKLKNEKNENLDKDYGHSHHSFKSQELRNKRMRKVISMTKETPQGG